MNCPFATATQRSAQQMQGWDRQQLVCLQGCSTFVALLLCRGLLIIGCSPAQPCNTQGEAVQGKVTCSAHSCNGQLVCLNRCSTATPAVAH